MQSWSQRFNVSLGLKQEFSARQNQTLLVVTVVCIVHVHSAWKVKEKKGKKETMCTNVAFTPIRAQIHTSTDTSICTTWVYVTYSGCQCYWQWGNSPGNLNSKQSKPAFRPFPCQSLSTFLNPAKQSGAAQQELSVCLKPSGTDLCFNHRGHHHHRRRHLFVLVLGFTVISSII